MLYMRDSNIRKAIIVSIGVLLILIGVVSNVWVLEKLFAQYGGIDSLGFRIIIWVFDLLMVTLGFVLVWFRKSIQLRNIALSVATVAIMLIALELLMIITEPWLFKGFYQYDSELGFRVRPYSRGSNSFGFNDRDYPLQKPTDIFRILIVGDSVSWAGGREGNYTALLERKFEDYYGRHKVDVINSGYPGTHTAEQLAMLKKFGLQYNPDLVVLGFFAGNDFIDANPHRKRVILNGVYIDIDIDKHREWVFLGRPIVPKSRLILLVMQRVEILGDEIGAKLFNAQRGTFSNESFLHFENERMDVCNLNGYRAGRYKERIDYILNSISQMNALLKTRRIRFVVAIYPDEFQVNENLADEIFSKFGLERKDYELELQQRLLKEYLNSEGIPFVDLLDDLKREQRGQNLYKYRDTHWNDAGNELAANLLFDYLVGMIDKGVVTSPTT